MAAAKEVLRIPLLRYASDGMTKFRLVDHLIIGHLGLKERTAGAALRFRAAGHSEVDLRFLSLFRRIEFSGAYILPRGVTGWALAVGMQGFEEAYQRRNLWRGKILSVSGHVSSSLQYLAH